MWLWDHSCAGLSLGLSHRGQADKIDKLDKSDNLGKLVRGATSATCYEAHHDLTT